MKLIEKGEGQARVIYGKSRGQYLLPIDFLEDEINLKNN